MLTAIGCLIAIPVIMFGVAILGLLAAIAIPSFVRARETAQHNACVNNLRVIDDAKTAWAKQNNASNGFLIPEDQFAQFLAKQHPGPLACPRDPGHAFSTSYEINPVGFVPTCLCDESHALED
jgi:type II secretory pathway pseudopilin PulG